jgi:hypothetical protein
MIMDLTYFYLKVYDFEAINIIIRLKLLFT